MFFTKRRSPSSPGLPSLPAADANQPEAPTYTARMLVDAIYEGLLSRIATEREIDRGMAMLAAGQPPSAIVEIVVNRTAFVQRVSDVRARYGLSEDRLVNCVSQNGEIEILLKLVINGACPRRMVVDVGARGKDGSNSYDLLRYLGWRGLLVEANPHLLDPIRKAFEGLDCVVESCAVSDYDGEAVFTIGVADDVSSLDVEAAARWGPVHGEVTVPVRRLGPLLDRHAIPHDFDLLSLDIEGHDVRVLNDLIGTTPFRPKWIILEGPFGGIETDLEKIGCSADVRALYAVVANTIANLILELRADPSA